MATFVRLARMTEHGARRMRDFSRVLAEAKETFDENGVKVLHAYATLGRYDFVVILEAPDQQSVMRACAMVGARGNASAETMAALPIDEFTQLFEE